MARRSQFEHLKEAILVLFGEGNKVADVLRVYPDVPRKTLYDWYNEFHTKSAQPSVTLVRGDNNNYERNVTPPTDVVVQFRDNSEENDVRWLKKKLKEIIRCNDAEPELVKLKAVRVQAINSYLQVIKYETAIPAINTTEDNEWEDAITNYEELDENDLAIRIKERLKKA